MTDDDGIGPWGPRRDLYFEREHRAGLARQSQWRDAAARTRDEADALERELSAIGQAVDRAEFGTGHWHRLVTLDERQRIRLGELRARVRRLRRAAEPTHAEILHEWAVQYDRVPPPSPGQLLLARSAKKPYRDR